MLLQLTLDFRKRGFRAGTGIGAHSGRMQSSGGSCEVQRITKLMLVGIFFQRSVEQDGILRVVFQQPI
jgi:hypothetical protein